MADSPYTSLNCLRYDARVPSEGADIECRYCRARYDHKDPDRRR